MRHPERRPRGGTVRRRELDRLVEHRDHHVETLDGELLLPEEGAPEVALHPLYLAEAAEQPAPARRAENARR